ncbi:MAG TPA: putative manganese-dependent inorganic diphosphatase [Baekduia sp.]|nr:putative manganese-dependent inorganic diphosphatase [Baekduia sp.]
MPEQDQQRPVVHVIGHRNPDTDSIAAAIGYAELRGRLDETTRYVPGRLGELTPQTAWALQQAGMPEPEFLPHVMLRVGDVLRHRFPIVSHDASVRDAGQLMVQEGLDLLPVVEDDGTLAGVLTEEALARRYVRESREASRLLAPTTVEHLAHELDGDLIAGAGHQLVDGRIWVVARAVETMLQDVSQGDVAVVGDRPDAQLRAVEADVGCVVLSNGVPPADGLLEAAERHDTPVIVTQLDSYVAGRMVTLSSPCSSLIDRDPLTARHDDLVLDVAEDVKDVSYRGAVVVDGQRRPVGLLTRAELVDPAPRRVILVDHAEQAQSVPGVEHAEIVEILDHHHIGSIETRLPVVATFDPVGSTSTLVAERFASHDLKPTPGSATALLAAVLADTVILSSPTTTDRDRAAAARLGGQVGRDPEEFGRELFRAGSEISEVPPAQLVGRDAKTYEVSGGQTLCIAQVEVVGGDAVTDGMLSELRTAVGERQARDGHRLVALMLTDVLEPGTRLLVAGDVSLAERALGVEAQDGVLDLPGVMSRKKQVAPRLLAAA